jgi:subtilase family serine protease
MPAQRIPLSRPSWLARRCRLPRARPRHPARSLLAAVALIGALALTACQAAPGPADSAPAAATADTSTPAGLVIDCLTQAKPTCYTPQQFRVAYGIAPLVARGIDGRGQTVVLPEFVPSASASGLSDVRADLARYDQLFALPAVRLRIITRLAGAASPNLASSEEFGDVEMVHAVAPQAAITVVLVPDVRQSGAAALASAYARALRLAAGQGSVIASTTGWGERCFTAAEIAAMHSALQAAQRRHVTAVVSSGDFGAASRACPNAAPYTPAKGLDYPASDPLVLAVGGTSLDASHTTGAYLGETVWNMPIAPGQGPHWASGGGFSSVFPRPAYQAGVPGTAAGRGVPDVAADAAPDTGLASVITTGQRYAIIPGSGTSAAAPFWAGVIAIADQYAGRSLGFVNPAIYRIGRSPAYHGAFHDVTQGNNTVTFPQGTITGYSASPGWDPVTGWGSPDAAVLVPLLARNIG